VNENAAPNAVNEAQNGVTRIKVSLKDVLLKEGKLLQRSASVDNRRSESRGSSPARSEDSRSRGCRVSLGMLADRGLVKTFSSAAALRA
jgi:hypothetical protein